jgi:acyl transferase domain-containing protein
LESLGRLWLAGAHPDWQALHAGNRRRRVRLPTYPFERKRYWFEPSKASVGRERIGRAASPAEWTYLPSWKRAPSIAAASNKRDANWLVFADRHGLGSQLETHLANGGAKVVSVTVGECFAVKGPGKYALNPAAREDYDRLLTALRAASFTPQFIAHLWSVRRDEELREDDDFSAECKDQGFFSWFSWRRRWRPGVEWSGRAGGACTSTMSKARRICRAPSFRACKVIGWSTHVRAL